MTIKDGLQTPYVVYIIVAINVAIFLLQLSDDRFTLAYSAVPYKLTAQRTVVPPGHERWLRIETDPRVASGPG